MYTIFEWKIVEIQRSLSCSMPISGAVWMYCAVLTCSARSLNFNKFFLLVCSLYWMWHNKKNNGTQGLYLRCPCELQAKTYSTTSVAYSQNKPILLLNNSKMWFESIWNTAVYRVEWDRLSQWVSWPTPCILETVHFYCHVSDHVFWNNPPFLPDCEKEKWKAPIKNCFWLVEI